MTEGFETQLGFLRSHGEVIVLGDEALGRAAVMPGLQGRVMTSTVPGEDGPGFGWLNHELIRSGPAQQHINSFGGEDRLWFGPEGGPFSIFFAPGREQVFEHWQTPAAIDSEAFEVVSQDPMKAVMRHRARFVNATRTTFEVEIERTVQVLEPVIEGGLTYETSNRVRNVGEVPWRAETGLLSIWVLGMLRATPGSVAVLPYRDAPGPLVKDDYFGKVPADRLADTGTALLFRGDGRHRSKIGLPAARAVPVIGAVHLEMGACTLANYSLPPAENGYVDSLWGDQTDPYAGDVVNSYNDDGALGTFFELETSSPALALAPGEAAVHTHATSHAVLSPSGLDAVLRSRLGVDLDRVREFTCR